MFENYKQLSAEEQTTVKATHRAVRELCKTHGRYGGLAWGFLRGFPYRRIERQTRTQVDPDGTVTVHNLPYAAGLHSLLNKHVEVTLPEVESWLANSAGAIPAPPPRVKREHVKAAE